MQRIKKNKFQSKQKPKIQLKRPLSVQCFKCSTYIEVKWNRGEGKYVERNNWGYWTTKEKNRDKWICDKDLISLYRGNKWEYLESIVSESRRLTLRTYAYDYKSTLN